MVVDKLKICNVMEEQRTSLGWTNRAVGACFLILNIKDKEVVSCMNGATLELQSSCHRTWCRVSTRSTSELGKGNERAL